ncbi:Small glutamine-rich tetratricopeptide repeat-containing protein 2 [Exophiala xenobiotica]|nr:Small glutamine-rich tetratricopeptide repeat-containing protein 2 [Exophiala xenobiotica]
MSLSDSKKRLALSILDFLSTSLKDGTLTADDADNIEIASNCIAEAFKVDPTDKAAMSEAVGSQSLLKIFQVYEKLNGKGATTETAAPPKPAEPAAINPEAEKLKSAGNSAMQQKDYKTAVEKYTEAIKFAPTNPIYLSNRAAAYSASGDHASAVRDAELAVASDPKYTKAWSRLGLARFAMGDAKGSVEAYQQGIDFEGNGGSEAMKKGLETAKKELARMEAEEENLPEDDVDDAPGNTRGGGGMPDLGGLASMLGGGGGAGGGGGGFDLGSIMNNPMFASMAQNIMRNPEALSGLMSNPTIQNMMNSRGGGGAGGGAGGGGGGGMPDMSQIQQMMQDPALANLAQQFMGGGAGRGAGAGRDGGR